MIKTFHGKHAFLSNFHPAEITYEGITYPTTEHAFQAAKTNCPITKGIIADKEKPGQAKRAGGKRGILPDFDPIAWGQKCQQVMLEINRLKFADPELAAKLKATGDQELQEGNNWNDTYWGISNKTGKGSNHLGKILMQIRSEI